MSNLAAMLTVVFGSEEWHLDETLTDLIDSRAVEPIIAVGIDNAGRRGRAREYLPYPGTFLRKASGSPTSSSPR